MIKRNCNICGKEFKAHQCHIKRGGGKFCSKKCSSNGHKNWRASKKTKAKMSNSRKGSLNPKWKGGKMTDHEGYVHVIEYGHPKAREGRYVREHRLIVEKIIKRYLTSNEIIHHVNGIRNDNRITNLIAFKSHAAHKKFHSNEKAVSKEDIIFDGRNHITP